MTEFDLQRPLMYERYRRNFILPNYEPKVNGRTRWWECDVFEVTDAGYWREYEIKLSRADFFADAKKDRPVAYNYLPGAARETKHAVLARGDRSGPSRFWYVMPAGLIQPEELPCWAGLIEFTLGRWQVPGQSCVQRERQVVPAPPIHNDKVDPKIVAHARSVCYWRMHAEFQAIIRGAAPAASDDGPDQPTTAELFDRMRAEVAKA